MNRLRVSRGGKSVSPGGWWEIDRGNDLVYHIDEPILWRRSNNLPDKIVLKGKWSLRSDNSLELKVDSRSRLVLRGKFIFAEPGECVFETVSADRSGCGIQHVRLLKLSGYWGCDGANKLEFYVSKKQAPDILTFTGSWKFPSDQRIRYTVEYKDRIRKNVTVSELEFSGYWELKDRNKLAYILSGASGSRFDFRVQAESENMYPATGVIKFRLGTGVKKTARRKPVIICIYGEWKFDKRAGLSFNVDYGNGAIRSIRFGVSLDLSDRDRVEMALLRENGSYAGMTLIYTRKFMTRADAEFFARLKERYGVKGFEAGVKIPF